MTGGGKSVLTGQYFMDGDTACAEGGLAAGCTFFGAYPITPATEIAERMAQRLPEVGGVFIQMEDELASMNAILGASWAGVKAMTATSGPGFSLMMENFGLGIALETPCVLVNIQRGGPSTGLPTLVGQADMMQARWGSHGDYEVIALAPNSPQECFDLVIEAFNLSEQYRMPVLVMADAAVGHMTEKVVIPPANEIELVPRRKPDPSTNTYRPFKPDQDLVPWMVSAGDGYRIHVTGLTHDERGYPVISAEVQAPFVQRLIEKVRRNAHRIIRTEERYLDDATVVVIAYGISSRVAASAVESAREEGIHAGLLRLITVWPFPEDKVRSLADRARSILVPEVNMGQMALEVERVASGKCEVACLPHPGGDVHRPEQILEAIRRAGA
jgi:2-oxoglutarate ferredoxin oxidoreductase subunit alpha